MRRALAIAPVLLAAACFDPTFSNPTCGAGESCPANYSCVDGVCRTMVVGVPDAEASTIDASLVDAAAADAAVFPDAPAGQCADWTFTPSNVPCIDPTGGWTVTATQTYNTDTGASSVSGAPVGAIVTQNDGTMVRLLSLDSFETNAGVSLQVRGSLPLIILVDGTATINGALDLVGVLGVAAAGSNSPLCQPSSNGVDGGIASNGGGGGGGGFGGGGALGGESGTGPGTPGPGGATGGNATLTPLRGGCRGGDGGSDSAAAGVGGASGGAVQIAARTSIAIAGTVALGGGGGGFGRTSGGGGGGGGSGGALLLEAPAVGVTGSLCANGGAGAEAAGQTQDGFGGESSKCIGAALGGGGGSITGGDGGDGSHLSVGPVTGMNGSANSGGGGGGGGGGGAGRITIRGTRTGAATVITPPATTLSL